MFDLQHLSLEDLLELNRAVVARIRHLQQERRERALRGFLPGDRVWFECDEGHRTYGTVVRVNRKTVSVITDDQHRWTVSPHYLRKLTEQEGILEEPAQNVLPFVNPRAGGGDRSLE